MVVLWLVWHQRASFQVRRLREELQLLQEQGSYVGEVVKAMDKKKVLVKVRLKLSLEKHSHGFDP